MPTISFVAYQVDWFLTFQPFEHQLNFWGIIESPLETSCSGSRLLAGLSPKPPQGHPKLILKPIHSVAQPIELKIMVVRSLAKTMPNPMWQVEWCPPVLTSSKQESWALIHLRFALAIVLSVQLTHLILRHWEKQLDLRVSMVISRKMREKHWWCWWETFQISNPQLVGKHLNWRSKLTKV